MRKNHPYRKNEAIVGIGFYRREQYQSLLETADDRDELDETYDEWLKSFKKAIKNARAVGIDPVRVDVDLEELLSYCKTMGLKNDAETRSKFYAELLKKRNWEK